MKNVTQDLDLQSSRYFPLQNHIPEVSWVGLLLEGMEGFPSPFCGIEVTFLWDCMM